MPSLLKSLFFVKNCERIGLLFERRLVIPPCSRQGFASSTNSFTMIDPVVLCFVLGFLLAASLIGLLVVHLRGRTKLEEVRQELGTINRNLLKAREHVRSKDEETGHLSKSLMRTKQDLLALEKKLQNTSSERERAIENLRLLEEKLAAMENRLQERDGMLGERDGETSRLRIAAEKAQAEAESLRESLDNSVNQFETYAASLMRVRQKIEEQLTQERYSNRQLQSQLEQLRRENAELRRRAGAGATPLQS